ncbi:UNVERIFIED_CONTAM: hypothetical protein K2H54_047618 [Gekko kuhli]
MRRDAKGGSSRLNLKALATLRPIPAPRGDQLDKRPQPLASLLNGYRAGVALALVLAAAALVIEDGDDDDGGTAGTPPPRKQQGNGKAADGVRENGSGAPSTSVTCARGTPTNWKGAQGGRSHAFVEKEPMGTGVPPLRHGGRERGGLRHCHRHHDPTHHRLLRFPSLRPLRAQARLTVQLQSNRRAVMETAGCWGFACLFLHLEAGA